MKLRKKISTTVQILSHIKEKLAFVQQQRTQAEQILEGKRKKWNRYRCLDFGSIALNIDALF